MMNIIQFSGGKDSLATLIWAKENLSDFDVVFCDTGWESPVTYKHIKDVEKALDIKINNLKGDFDFKSLSIKKKRFASTKARFCTEFLKVRPFIDLVLLLESDLTIYQGIRAEESKARRQMSANDEYFRGYIEGKHKYRKKEVLAHIDQYSVDVVRPIFKWTSDQVFEYIQKSGLAPNELYKAGFSRVGCFPCVMCRHAEIKQIAKRYPERIDLIRDLEKEVGRSFFPPDYIPTWACKNGSFPFIDEVISYLHNPNQKELFTAPSCQSVYNLCE